MAGAVLSNGNVSENKIEVSVLSILSSQGTQDNK